MGVLVRPYRVGWTYWTQRIRSIVMASRISLVAGFTTRTPLAPPWSPRVTPLGHAAAPIAACATFRLRQRFRCAASHLVSASPTLRRGASAAPRFPALPVCLVGASLRFLIALPCGHGAASLYCCIAVGRQCALGWPVTEAPRSGLQSRRGAMRGGFAALASDTGKVATPLHPTMTTRQRQ